MVPTPTAKKMILDPTNDSLAGKKTILDTPNPRLEPTNPFKAYSSFLPTASLQAISGDSLPMSRRTTCRGKREKFEPGI